MKNDARQSPSVPVSTTGSPRSPQPDGSAHTPGPWTVEEQWAHDCEDKPFRYAFWIADAEGVELAASILDRVNAQVFASAPDLLGVCREFVAMYDAGTRQLCGSVVLDRLARAEAAIAKAEGR